MLQVTPLSLPWVIWDLVCIVAASHTIVGHVIGLLRLQQRAGCERHWSEQCKIKLDACELSSLKA